MAEPIIPPDLREKPRRPVNSNVGPDGRTMETALSVFGNRGRSCSPHRAAGAHCGPLLQGSSLLQSLLPFSSQPSRRWLSAKVASAPSVESLLQSPPAVLGAPLAQRRVVRLPLATQKRSCGAGFLTALRSTAVSPAPTFVPPRPSALRPTSAPNPAVEARLRRWDAVPAMPARRPSPSRWAQEQLCFDAIQSLFSSPLKAPHDHH